MDSVQQAIRQIQVHAQEDDARLVASLTSALEECGPDSPDARYYRWEQNLQAAQARMARRNINLGARA